LANTEIQALLDIHNYAAGPDVSLNLLSGYQIAGTAREQRQELERLRAELQADPGLPELSLLQIKLENPKTKNLAGRGWRHAAEKLYRKPSAPSPDCSYESKKLMFSIQYPLRKKSLAAS
jgi:hypothetical protein